MKYIEHINEFNTNDKLSKIESEINSALEKYKNNPEEFVKYDIEKLKAKLLKNAKENGYRGKIVIRKSANDNKSKNANKKFIIYEPKNTLLQDIGSAAANARRS